MTMTRRVFVVGTAAGAFALAAGVVVPWHTAASSEAAPDAPSPDGDEVPSDKVPKAVTEAVHKLFPGVKFDSVTKYTDEKVVHYEVFFAHKKSEYEVTVTEGGKVIEVAREIGFDDLPKPVAEAVRKKYPRAKVGEVAELTEPGVVGKHYHVELTTARGDEVALTYDPHGKLVDEE